MCFTACSFPSLFAPPQLQLPVGVSTPQRNCVLLLLLSQGISNANSTSLGKSCLTVTGSLFSRFVKLRATAKTQPSCQTSLKGRGKNQVFIVYFRSFIASSNVFAPIASTLGVGRGLFLTARLHLIYALSLFFSDFLCNLEDFSHWDPLMFFFSVILTSQSCLPACDMAI